MYVSMMTFANELSWVNISLANLKYSPPMPNRNVPQILGDQVVPWTVYHNHFHITFSRLLCTLKINVIPRAIPRNSQLPSELV